MTADVPQTQKRRKSIANHMADRNELLKEALERIAKNDVNEKDDAAVFSDSWAASFRNLSSTQQLYAKKAIEEILVLGQLDLLSLNSVTPSSSSSTSNSSTTPTSYGSPVASTHTEHAILISPPPTENAINLPQHARCRTYRNIQDLLSDNNYY